jgi:hypothetical protein
VHASSPTNSTAHRDLSPGGAAELSPALQRGVQSATDARPGGTTEIGDRRFQGHDAQQPISLFLMINTFETGGSERQFTVLAQSLTPPEFQTHLGCIHRQGPLADNFPNAPEFPLGGSLFKWRSLLTRLNLSRHLRQRHVQVAHAFDFYTNLTLIPAAKMARVPVVIGSHRQL